METLTPVIIIVLLLINLFLFYLIIQSATKSKQLSRNSDAQLKVLIEIALNQGIPINKLANEIEVYKNNKIKEATGKYNSGKMTKAELLNLKENL